MSNSEHDIQEQLRELRLAYSRQLPGKLDEIEAYWRKLRDGQWERDCAELLHRATHNLCGSGSTFGYSQLSKHARSIEQIIKAHLHDNVAADPDQCAQIDLLLKELREAATLSPASAHESNGECDEHRAASLPTHPLVYVIEGDARLSGEFQLQLEHFGYRSEVFADTKGVREAVSRKKPAAFIVDISLAEGPTAGIDLLRDSKDEQGCSLPVIFISSHDDFAVRLAAVRAGGDAYFVKPVEIGAVIDRLDQLIPRKVSEPYRILAVEDDSTLAAHYALVLRDAGMHVEIVSDPEDVMAALAEFNPELILMDVYMPTCSGLELAKLIRQQNSYLGVPIVFLSSETNLEKQFNAMRMGGDDFLTKPILGKHLVSSVMVRAERARLVNALMSQDSLTGLLNHTKIKEELQVELARALRTELPLTFVMIDIDHFKDINDRYGHMTGDRVIKTLARMLQQRLRTSDRIGRYGGEEFAVILPDCDIEMATSIMEEMRMSFADINYLADGVEFSASFSAGLASFPAVKESAKLIKAADAALYDAKTQGRNRISTGIGDKSAG